MKNRGIFHKFINGILVLIAIAAVFLTTNTTAKWASQGIGSDGARVAVFAVDVKDISSNDLELNCNNGITEASYQFAVTNQKNGATSEVSMKYTILVALPEEMPEGLTMTIDGVTGTLDPSGKICSFTAAGWTFEPGIEETRIHTLTLSADPELLDFNLELDEVSVGVTFEQIETAGEPITVKIPKSLAVTKMPDKTGYINNQTFERTGMEVTVTYTDNTTAVVSNYKVNSGKLTVGQSEVTISYSENGITKETTVPVSVGYGITYNANAGLFTNGNTTNTVGYFTDGSAVPGGNSYQEPSRTGYNFIGWYMDPNCTDGNEFELTNISANETVYAKWNLLNYSITYDPSGSSAVEAQDYTITSNVTLAAAPTREGYTFAGWKLTTATGGWSSQTYSASEDIGTGKYGDITLVALWNTIDYEITYNLDGGTVATENPESYNIEADAITLNNPTRQGYTFKGWTGSNGTTAQTSVTIAAGSTGNKSYTANWTANTYSVKYNANGGSGTMSNSSHTYDTANALTANTFTRTGYTFSGWNTKADGSGTAYGDKASVENLSSTQGATVNLYAQWDKTYIVRYNANGGSGTMKDQTFVYGKAGYLSSNTFTKTYYNFSGWNTMADGSGTAYTSSQQVSNLTSTAGGIVTLYAQWGEAYATNLSASTLSYVGYTGGASFDIPAYYQRYNAWYKITALGTTSGSRIFKDYPELTSITIPDSVTEIYKNAFDSNYGYGPSLSSLTIPNSVTTIGKYAFWYATFTDLTIGNSVTSIGEYAFADCPYLTSIVIPDSLTSIASGTWERCTSLTSVTIGNSVTSIGSRAFAGCSSLTSIVIPVSTTSIGNYAFENTSNLTNVYYEGTQAQWNAISIGAGNDYLTNATIHYGATAASR